MSWYLICTIDLATSGYPLFLPVASLHASGPPLHPLVEQPKRADVWQHELCGYLRITVLSQSSSLPLFLNRGWLASSGRAYLLHLNHFLQVAQALIYSSTCVSKCEMVWRINITIASTHRPDEVRTTKFSLAHT